MTIIGHIHKLIEYMQTKEWARKQRLMGRWRTGLHITGHFFPLLIMYTKRACHISLHWTVDRSKCQNVKMLNLRNLLQPFFFLFFMKIKIDRTCCFICRGLWILFIEYVCFNWCYATFYFKVPQEYLVSQCNLSCIVEVDVGTGVCRKVRSRWSV